MDQNLKDKTLDNLTKSQSVLILVSENSGTDGLASGLALHLSLSKIGKNVSILAKAPSVGDAQKLYGVDKVGQFKGNKNLVVVINNAVETIDRVSHFLDGDKLKLILHVFPQSNGIAQDQISFEEEGIKPDVVFAIGYSSEEELRKEIERVQNIDSTSWLINICLKDLGQILAQVNVFNANAASLSEITGDYLNQMAFPLDEDIAYNLYTGISEATSGFSPARTSPLSLEIASWLLKFGAGRASFAATGQPVVVQNFTPAEAPQSQSQPQPQPQPVAVPAQPFPAPQYTQPVPPPEPAPVQAPLSTAAALNLPVEEVPLIENIEPETKVQEQPQAIKSDKSWLKPPKIYKGSESF